ncbi:flagellar basal body-associated FliL family protein [Salipiger bermudensis]|uniref:Flagellar protein FliL n=1 Tax=Salipiger bermudensis (strain DSM 26914 / JCM 13377 / KCTC 12554 / HTCC2601) TaxID=314265 RepID=Q0FQN5_SALBH|nr:flagellar basal body-associated FliL family protein [Salipiger bermudensis]EAU46416.1 flagellar basal body-associated protein FliL [Salipiger bermudensis HTCC2601]
MTDATADAPAEDEGTPKKKGSKLPMLIGLVLALAGGGGGFYAAWSGLLPFGGGHAPAEEAHGEGGQGAAGGHGGDPALPLPDTNVAFVELEPLVISMGTIAELHHLRFRASLEVPPQYVAEVETLTPRVIDVLNSYLRALRPSDIEAPGALIRLRSQMLRRIQMVAGEDRIRDLLVMEFVLN